MTTEITSGPDEMPPTPIAELVIARIVEEYAMTGEPPEELRVAPIVGGALNMSYGSPIDEDLIIDGVHIVQDDSLNGTAVPGDVETQAAKAGDDDD